MRIIAFVVCAVTMAGGVGLTAAGLMSPRGSDQVIFVGWGAALLTLAAAGVALTIIHSVLNLFDHRPPGKS